MYRNVKTRVKMIASMIESFKVKIGLHQSSALSSFLFNIVFDIIMEEVWSSVGHFVYWWCDVNWEIKIRSGSEDRRVAYSTGKVNNANKQEQDWIYFDDTPGSG